MNNYLNNSFSLIGNIAYINEIKEQINGKKFRYFTIAQNNKYKNKDGEQVNEPSFINIKIFEKNFTEFEKILEIGRYVHVMGKLKFYKDNENNEKVLLIGISCNDMSKDKKKEVEEIFDYDWLNEEEYGIQSRC